MVRDQEPHPAYHKSQKNNGWENVAPIPCRDASLGILVSIKGRPFLLNPSDRSEFAAGRTPAHQTADDPAHLAAVYRYLGHQGTPPPERESLRREKHEFDDIYSWGLPVEP